MTIHQAIQALDTLSPNPYGSREKLRWLCALEMRIYEECIPKTGQPCLPLRGRCRPQAAEGVRGRQLHFPGWDVPRKPPVFDGWEGRDLGEALLLPPAYEEVYVLWLLSQVDFYNGEWGRYNNSAARFNQAYAEAARGLNRAARGAATANVRARNY